MTTNMNSLVPMDGTEEQGGAIVAQDESMTIEHELEMMLDQINVTLPIQDQNDDQVHVLDHHRVYLAEGLQRRYLGSLSSRRRRC